MLALLYVYLCVPRGLRFIFRWLAVCFVILVFITVLLLFLRVLTTLPRHRRQTHLPGLVSYPLATAHHSRVRTRRNQ